MTSDLFNFALVFFGTSPGLKEGSGAGRTEQPSASGIWSDIAAAVLLGMAMFSKPLNILLIGPPVCCSGCAGDTQRGSSWASCSARPWRACSASPPSARGNSITRAAIAGLFYTTFRSTRRSIPGAAGAGAPERRDDHERFGRRQRARPVGVSESLPAQRRVFLHRAPFWFVPYFFPGCVAIALWLLSRRRFDAWRVLTFLGLAASTLVLLVFFPYTWSGGGGPVGNRYFLNLILVVSSSRHR